MGCSLGVKNDGGVTSGWFFAGEEGCLPLLLEGIAGKGFDTLSGGEDGGGPVARCLTMFPVGFGA